MTSAPRLRRPRPARRLSSLLLALLLAPLPLAAPAASLSVDPVGFHLGTGRPTGVLRIGNTGDAPLRFQVSAVRWFARDGHAEEIASDDIIVNPPIFTVAQGALQVLRFALRDAAASDRETSFRLIIEEVPGQPAATAEALHTLLRISIPVFLAPRQSVHQVDWKLVRRDGQACLVASNLGTVHERLQHLKAQAGPGQPDLLAVDPGYLLPGEQRVWPLAVPLPAGGLRVQADGEQGPLAAALAAPE